MMKILYIGDIMAKPGITATAKVLPTLRQEYRPDLIIAQAENVTNGKGMSITDMDSLRKAGIDFFTGGNHTPAIDELKPRLEDENNPVIGPANMPACPGRGWKYVDTKQGKVLVISLLGKIVGKDAEKPMENPLKTIDAILAENEGVERAATIVNFHGDYSSEKRVIGYYLDGRVTAVIGDHWHTPTADAMILPKGTAHITDVGMCGSLHSSLGVKTEVIVSRWRDGRVSRNELSEDRPYQFNAVLIEIDRSSGLATKIEQIQRTVN